jgi:PAS domain-containing protein
VQKIKDLKLRYRRLFETAQDGILILDARTGMIENVNPYLIKMLGTHAKSLQKIGYGEWGIQDIEASKKPLQKKMMA